MREETFGDFIALQQNLELNKGKRVIFDARELPFFCVQPEYSNLGSSQEFKREITANYPKLACFLGCVVDGAIIIQDILPQTNTFNSQTAEKFFDITRNLNKTSRVTLQVVDAGTLTYYLFKMIDKPIIQSKKPLCVFPGEGAKIMKEYITGLDPSYKLPQSVKLSCKKVMTQKGKFDLTIDFSPLPNSLETDTVIIFDDVVASGQTAQTVAQGIKERYGNVRVVVATWLFLNPTVKENKGSPSGIQDVDLTIASFALKGNYTSRPPINSLSCFLRNEEKYDQVKENFIQRYIADRNQFLDMVKQLEQDIIESRGK